MKILIIGSNLKELKNISEKIKKIYNINLYQVSYIEKANEIIRKNKEWIIISNYNEFINIVASSSTTIIYLKNNSKENNDIRKEFIKKYSSKILILKNKKEIKKLFNAIYEGLEL